MNIIRQLRVTAAVAACRGSAALLRLMGKGGTNMPGVIARKICPDILSVTSAGVKTVLVTGTNGKTTTCRIVEEALRRGGYTVLANRSGANLLGGAVTTFTQNARLSGRARAEAAVIECDEAAFAHITRYVDADAAICTNLFRDQLDRYGALDFTVGKIRTGMSQLKRAALCVNGDCALSCSAVDGAEERAHYFTVELPNGEAVTAAALADAGICPKCGSQLKYDYLVYGHLGRFRCPDCGWGHGAGEVAVTSLLKSTEDVSEVTMRIDGEELELSVNLPGVYNLYNAAAAITAALSIGVSREAAIAAVGGFECGFGRLEKIKVGGADMRMILVKNPTGLEQALGLAAAPETRAIAILLNDNTGDGRDVSWIWDADLEKLADCPAKLYVSGIRADELALRLKYAGIAPERVIVEPDCAALCDMLCAEVGKVFLLPTYSAMFDLRAELGRHTELPDFWE